MWRASTAVAVVLLLADPVSGQETGVIAGRVRLDDGSAIAGVTITAAGDVLPQARTTLSSADGDYRFTLLPPGNYVLTFEMDGLATQIRALQVLLEQTSVVDISMSAVIIAEILEVVAAEESLDTQSTAVSTAISDEVISALPVGQEYRDLVKLAPGVPYTENAIRGPSVGGNGQDNVYKLDGVDVTLPLFGTISTEPASYDVEQVSFLKGGATAVDFNRSGGMTMNSVTRSGTDRWKGFFGLRVQTAGMTAARVEEDIEEFVEDRSWLTFGVGGPLLEDKLYFYGSYYRPEVREANRANVYGEVPDFESVRNEYFAKLTWTPTHNLLLAGSYRDSERDDSGRNVGPYSAATRSNGADESIVISFLEGSWLIDARSSFYAKYSNFENPTGSIPDHLLSISVGPGIDLDIANLDRQGGFQVPITLDDNPEFNEWALPIIEQYGYLDNGVPQGGGTVGVTSTLRRTDYFREQLGLGYDYYLADHQLHVGLQWYEVAEDYQRISNGWGWIEPTGGRQQTGAGDPVYYTAWVYEQTYSDRVPPTVSSFESRSIELNDMFTLGDWTFNIGVILSNDTFFGSGLRETGEGASGHELASGNEYEMIDIGFGDLIQPRLGVTWSWNGREKAFASHARYHPAASSLPRSASWDRNLAHRQVGVQFDIDGVYLSQDPLRGSSGKWFQEDMEPRYIDELLIGYDRQFSNRWLGRSHFRYRHGANFWEDTNNDARLRYDPPSDVPQELYVPNLAEIQAEIGGSSYVIAQLDDAFTDYYEVSLEAEYRGAKAYLRGSYVWSQYYGNFDQDGTNPESDNAVFIGSSFIGDGAGRQLWNYRYGYLQGDRRHNLKLYGTYEFEWNAVAGAWFVYQDGSPWQICDVEPYRVYTGSLNERSRFAEPAGSRRTDDHYQLDLSYTQNLPFRSRFNIRLRADLFNVLNRQTGLDIEQRKHSAGFGDPLRYIEPRRLQLAVSFEF